MNLLEDDFLSTWANPILFSMSLYRSLARRYIAGRQFRGPSQCPSCRLKEWQSWNLNEIWIVGEFYLKRTFWHRLEEPFSQFFDLRWEFARFRVRRTAFCRMRSYSRHIYLFFTLTINNTGLNKQHDSLLDKHSWCARLRGRGDGRRVKQNAKKPTCYLSWAR